MNAIRYVVMFSEKGLMKKVLQCKVDTEDQILYGPGFKVDSITEEHTAFVDKDLEVYLFHTYPEAYDFLVEMYKYRDYWNWLSDPTFNPLPVWSWALCQD